MASSIYIIGADGANYHLAGAGVSYTGSGSPWTAPATSPFELSMNDVTGPSYTPQAPQPLDIYNGGPPFRVGADLSFRGYGNVTESFGLQMRHHDRVALHAGDLRHLGFPGVAPDRTLAPPGDHRADP